MWCLKQYKSGEVPAMHGRIVVVGEFKHCALLHSACDLKATQMNVQLYGSQHRKSNQKHLLCKR